MNAVINSLMLKRNGVTLIELLIALVISSILVAGLYRTFLGQQKTANVQEQVIDMQQNARLAIQRMMREIRMAGFGNISDVLPLNAHDGPFNSTITPGDGVNGVGQNDDRITIIGAFERISTLKSDVPSGTNVIELQGYGSEFNTANKKYLSIGGIEAMGITDVTGNTITFGGSLKNSYPAGTSVYKIEAITYSLNWDPNHPTRPILRREDNTNGGGAMGLADNIENLQFHYLLADGTESDAPANPANVRVVQVTITARTKDPDPTYKGGDGYRRRQIVSNIQVRNMGIVQ